MDFEPNELAAEMVSLRARWWWGGGGRRDTTQVMLGVSRARWDTTLVYIIMLIHDFSIHRQMNQNSQVSFPLVSATNVAMIALR